MRNDGKLRQWLGNGVTTTYAAANNLNQYPSVGGVAATYDGNGNLKTYDGWTYIHDAQNRLKTATKTGQSATFYYDGLNRQIARTINGITTFSVWDGWDLAEEYRTGNILDASYLHGAATDELVSMVRGGQTYYFYQDGRGNTSAVANQNGQLIEYYRYGLAGHVAVFDAAGNQLANSSINNRFLFTGREYYPELGLYNYRNRFYSPDLNRFLQPDPIGFRGGDYNLYRYCGNNPANRRDPFGLQVVHKINGDSWATVDPVIVTGREWTGVNSPGEWRLGDIGSLPNFPGGLGFGYRREGGDGFSIRTGVKPQPLLPDPTIASEPLPQVPYTPPINAVAYGSYIPTNPYTNQPIWMPPTASLSANIAAAQHMNALQYRNAVTHQWNYKTQGSVYDPFGNFNAGATGRAAGFPTVVIQWGAGVNQYYGTNVHDPSWGTPYSGAPWGDDPIDQYMIEWGAEYYDSGGGD